MIKHLDCRYLRAITDDAGVWQHAEKGGISPEHGYALDDSARGLIAALNYGEERVAQSCLGFLERVCTKDGVVNFLDASCKPVDHPASYDAIGEAFWALGTCLEYGFEVVRARALIALLLPQIKLFDGHLRARAYTVLGLLKIEPKIAYSLSQELYETYLHVGTSDWPWPETSLRYANAILPLALLRAGTAFSEPTWVEAGRTMLTFLNSATKKDGVPIAIGNKGWFLRGGECALYDQQPIDPAYQVLANVEAGLFDEAEIYLSWFWGNNLLGLPLIDEKDGSCRDGLHAEGVSENHGSENIVCYLIAQRAYEMVTSSIRE